MTYVVARLMGGIGNQLFIYAAARRLAEVNGIPLLLDSKSGFVRDQYKREYALKPVLHNEKFAPEGDIPGVVRRNIYRIANYIVPFDHQNYIQEKVKPFDSRLLTKKIDRVTYLDGLWQSERYFCDYQDLIRKEIFFSSMNKYKDAPIFKKIIDSHAVSLSVRRLHGVQANKTVPRNDIPKLKPSYYQKAIDIISQKRSGIEIFCFTDCLNWAKDNLKLDFPITFVSEENLNNDPYFDLWLISQCKDHIIANSTFSWWGAWLNSSSEKLVIAPKLPMKDFLTEIPASWNTVETELSL